MSGPDISESAVERLLFNYRGMMPHDIEKLILALRAALDAAERERDEAHYDACRTVTQRLADAQATGYARGVKAAVDNARAMHADGWHMDAIIAAVLALLPDATKETRDAE